MYSICMSMHIYKIMQHIYNKYSLKPNSSIAVFMTTSWITHDLFKLKHMILEKRTTFQREREDGMTVSFQ